jgi:hypothetical protein
VTAGGIAAVLGHGAVLAAAVLVCAAFSSTGANPVAPIPLAALVAMHWAARREMLGNAAAAAAILVGYAATQQPMAGVFYGLFATAGIPLGAGMRRAWPFGRIVAVVTAWTFGAFALFLALHMTWAGWVRQAAASYDAFRAEIQSGTQEAADQEALTDFFEWVLVDHWADVSIGMVFASLLLCTALATAVVAWWARKRHGVPGPGTTFAAMRPPEWLVWAVILCAVLWFVDRRVDAPALKAAVWNGAIGLAAVYWLNGLGIVVYGFRALQPHVFVAMALVLFLAYAGGWMLSFIGLFDTWWAFRAKIDRLVEARDKLKEGPKDDD